MDALSAEEARKAAWAAVCEHRDALARLLPPPSADAGAAPPSCGGAADALYAVVDSDKRASALDHVAKLAEALKELADAEALTQPRLPSKLYSDTTMTSLWNAEWRQTRCACSQLVLLTTFPRIRIPTAVRSTKLWPHSRVA